MNYGEWKEEELIDLITINEESKRNESQYHHRL